MTHELTVNDEFPLSVKERNKQALTLFNEATSVLSENAGFKKAVMQHYVQSSNKNNHPGELEFSHHQHKYRLRFFENSSTRKSISLATDSAGGGTEDIYLVVNYYKENLRHLGIKSGDIKESYLHYMNSGDKTIKPPVLYQNNKVTVEKVHEFLTKLKED